MFWDLLDVVLPTACAGCGGPLSGRRDSRLCSDCAATVARSVWPIQVAGLDAAWVWVPYDHPVGVALRRGKYRPDPAALAELGRGLGRACREQIAGVDQVVPVPRSWQHLARAGLEPTSVLASLVAKELARPMSRSLRRHHGTTQAALTGDRRRENVRGAFWSAAPLPRSSMLLVDDVVTTGATAQACAEALRAAGAARVVLLAVCSPLI